LPPPPACVEVEAVKGSVFTAVLCCLILLPSLLSLKPYPFGLKLTGGAFFRFPALQIRTAPRNAARAGSRRCNRLLSVRF